MTYSTQNQKPPNVYFFLGRLVKTVKHFSNKSKLFENYISSIPAGERNCYLNEIKFSKIFFSNRNILVKLKNEDFTKFP